MRKVKVERLAPREREVAEAVFALGEASAIEIGTALSEPLSNSAVRSMLRRLQEKGVLRRRREGKKYYYAPAAGEKAAGEAALQRVSREYFGGSLSDTARAMLDLVEQSRRRQAAGRRGMVRFDRYGVGRVERWGTG
ncbi:MAG: BlaI/MecI/CopY family transcriptional regulator [Allosphingosinicella sp.]